MFGKMMNSYYYGNSGKGDYRKEDLPKNRWQLFWEMLRVRFSGLMRLNLMYAVVWIPVILVTIFSAFALTSTQMRLNEVGEWVQVPAAEARILMGDVMQIFFLLLIPTVAITGPATAGVSYVTRNWARDEHAFIWSDFKDAVKENWKQGLGISSITAVMPFVLYVCWMFYGEMARESPLFMVPQVLATMMGLVWYLALIYMYPLMVSYKLRFRDLLRNGLLLAIGRLPHTLGLRLLSILPCAIALAVTLFVGQEHWVVLGMVLYYLLFGFYLSRFTYASYANAVFDRFINSRIQGAIINRGLSQEEDDEDEYDDDEDAE